MKPTELDSAEVACSNPRCGRLVILRAVTLQKLDEIKRKGTCKACGARSPRVTVTMAERPSKELKRSPSTMPVNKSVTKAAMTTVPQSRLKGAPVSRKTPSPPTAAEARELAERFRMARMGAAGRVATSVAGPVKPSLSRRCDACGREIASGTLEAIPHTRHCAEHLDLNPRAATKEFDPRGTREDFKKDSGANWCRARNP